MINVSLVFLEYAF